MFSVSFSCRYYTFMKVGDIKISYNHEDIIKRSDRSVTSNF